MTKTSQIAPKWFYKLLFVTFSKLAEWARKKAGIELDQHKEADKGTKEIKDAADNVKDTPVNPDTRPDNDMFNNDVWNDGVHKR